MKKILIFTSFVFSGLALGQKDPPKKPKIEPWVSAEFDQTTEALRKAHGVSSKFSDVEKNPIFQRAEEQITALPMGTGESEPAKRRIERRIQESGDLAVDVYELHYKMGPQKQAVETQKRIATYYYAARGLPDGAKLRLSAVTILDDGGQPLTLTRSLCESFHKQNKPDFMTEICKKALKAEPIPVPGTVFKDETEEIIPVPGSGHH